MAVLPGDATTRPRHLTYGPCCSAGGEPCLRHSSSSENRSGTVSASVPRARRALPRTSRATRMMRPKARGKLFGTVLLQVVDFCAASVRRQGLSLTEEPAANEEGKPRDDGYIP